MPCSPSYPFLGFMLAILSQTHGQPTVHLSGTADVFEVPGRLTLVARLPAGRPCPASQTAHRTKLGSPLHCADCIRSDHADWALRTLDTLCRTPQRRAAVGQPHGG